MTAASALDGTELFEGVQGAVSTKVSADQQRTYSIQGQITTKTADATLALADKDEVEMNVASANNLTVPPNSSVAFPIGTIKKVTQLGAGRTTIVAGSGVTIRTRSTLVMQGQYAKAWLIKRATDEWVLFGDLLGSQKQVHAFACSDRTTALATGTDQGSMPMLMDFYVTEVHASLEGAVQTSGSTFTVDVNDDGSTMLSTKITIDNGEYSSVSAATPPVLTSTPLLVAKGSKISADIDAIGDGTAKGLVVGLVGYPA